MLENNLNLPSFSLFHAAFFDLTRLIYCKNLKKIKLLHFLRQINILFEKIHLPVIALIRTDLMDNEFMFLFPKAVIISDRNYYDRPEERFSDSIDYYSSSILSKSGSGKLEIDDGFEFNITQGFRHKKFDNQYNIMTEDSFNRLSDTQTSISIFKKSEKRCKFSESLIVIEDSDRDSGDEMEADSNF